MREKGPQTDFTREKPPITNNVILSTREEQEAVYDAALTQLLIDTGEEVSGVIPIEKYKTRRDNLRKVVRDLAISTGRINKVKHDHWLLAGIVDEKFIPREDLEKWANAKIDSGIPYKTQQYSKFFLKKIQAEEAKKIK